jgi:hypothetical protein
MQLLCFVKRFACIRPMGAFMCAGGALCGFRALVWLCLLFACACFCLACVELLSLSKGTESCLLQVILFFAFPLALARLLKFICSFFSFTFLFGYQLCVLSMHTSMGRWRTCVVRGPVDGRFLVC